MSEIDSSTCAVVWSIVYGHWLLIFDISWLFSPQVHYIVLLVMAALRAHAVLAVTSLTFPSLSKLPCSLYIPSKSYEEKITHSPWALHVHDLFLSQNMDVPKMVVSFILPIFLIQFKVRLFQNVYISNLFISILALTCIIITLTFLFYWNVLYRFCLRLMVKYNTLLNWVLEILLFAAVIILRVFLSLLDPLYKVLLHIKPQVKFSLVQYFWHKKSKCFLSSLITTCLLVFHGILFNLGTTHNLVLDCELHSAPVYLLAVAIILTISALPYPFLVGSYVVSVMALG